MGWVLAIVAVLFVVLMLLLLSLRSISTHSQKPVTELEALIEASGTVEQQRHGLERGRVVRVLAPKRALISKEEEEEGETALTFEEKLALKSIGSTLPITYIPDRPLTPKEIRAIKATGEFPQP